MERSNGGGGGGLEVVVKEGDRLRLPIRDHRGAGSIVESSTRGRLGDNCLGAGDVFVPAGEDFVVSCELEDDSSALEIGEETCFDVVVDRLKRDIDVSVEVFLSVLHCVQCSNVRKCVVLVRE